MKFTRKLLAVVLAALLLAAMPLTTFANSQPVRAFFEEQGARVEWNEALRQITVHLDGHVIRLYVGSEVVFVDDVPLEISGTVAIESDRSFIAYSDGQSILSALAAVIPALDLGAHGTIAYGHLEFIDANFPNRIGFTQAERDVADWIVGELIAMGHYSGNIRLQEFPQTSEVFGFIEQAENFDDYREFWLYAFGTSDEELVSGIEFLETSQNVVLTVPGQSERKIVVGAHYDSVFTAGISDNASGVVMLLESAERVLQLDNYYTIVYVFFGAEEIGILGARYFVESLTEEQAENLALMVNIDIIFNGHELTFGSGERDEAGEEARSEITLFVDAIADRINAQYGLELTRQPGGSTLGSDNLEFLNAGFPVVVFYALEGFDPYEVFDLPSFWTMELLDQIEAILDGGEENGEDVEEALIKLAQSTAEDWEFEIEDIQGAMGIEANHEVPGLIEQMQSDIAAFERILVLMEHPNFEALMATVEIPELSDEPDEFFEEEPGDVFIGGYLHTANDNLAFINETWPGLIERALRAYSIFLEYIKLMEVRG